MKKFIVLLNFIFFSFANAWEISTFLPLGSDRKLRFSSFKIEKVLDKVLSEIYEANGFDERDCKQWIAEIKERLFEQQDCTFFQVRDSLSKYFKTVHFISEEVSCPLINAIMNEIVPILRKEDERLNFLKGLEPQRSASETARYWYYRNLMYGDPIPYGIKKLSLDQEDDEEFDFSIFPKRLKREVSFGDSPTWNPPLPPLRRRGVFIASNAEDEESQESDEE